jgi:hypothetical protein
MSKFRRAIPMILGTLSLGSLGVLLAWDAFPERFPANAHDYVAAFSLAMVALAYLSWQTMRQPSAMEFLKAAMLALAFLFWAANQFWPDHKEATLYNDIAIALFVLDVLLVMIGWPSDGKTDHNALE